MKHPGFFGALQTLRATFRWSGEQPVHPMFLSSPLNVHCPLQTLQISLL